MVTTLVGRYEVTQTLGGGGFAITYLARDIMQPSKPLCVVKQLRPNQNHPRVIDFFNKEAAILEKLGKHPQIPQLLAHFQEEDNLYIVQEFIEGHDLSQELSPGKRLSEAYVNKLLKDVLEVLSFVHKYGVIHRDIKPQNLMRRREDGRIFLIDFGAVKELGSLMINTQGEIKSSVVIGTPGFMPTEQGLGKPCLASDIYAVGMIAIQALTGLQPFELEENPQTGEVIWLEKSQVSQNLAEVITKMVRRHYSLRYSHATDALQGLTTLAQTVPTPSIESTLLNPPIPSPNPVPTPQPITPTPTPVSTPQITPTPKSTINFSRRRTLQILGFAGGGLVTAIIANQLFTKPSIKDNNETAPLSRNDEDQIITPRLDLGGDTTLNGAGASFPRLLYERWFKDINFKYPNLRINYQSIGSGAGVRQFIAGTVDFGASDVAMKDEEIAKVDRGVLLLPMTGGSVVLAYNLPGINELKLPRQVYTDIFLGQITKWNDPEIAAANPSTNLPDQNITVVTRSDGSGTTAVFTKHLSAISDEWKNGPGDGKTISWPTGIGAKRNEGITAQVQQTPGAIGYVEYGYGKNQGLTMATLENKAGKFVAPSDESASKALGAIDLPENLRAFILDPEGEESYPIVTFTWLLAYKNYDNPATAKAMEAMIEYALTEGQKAAPELGYVPLPANVVEKVAAAADAISPEYPINVASN
ncbi:phosphate ABC transporter periplasmic phosphate-binding protein [Calothrix parasitica NIES-267]|uniref:Phosphate ABC transporter periplasmic phosphate-binding protein n=1 Tax=Calothrix parasitica NIES-267 TaxID=1973488 RepID=A0A1Z4LHR1_9CYAN|nr:phosphate ABC transporter periplasmic phosphate-binding protein [Calothrix parasitica NIES-267]